MVISEPGNEVSSRRPSSFKNVVEFGLIHAMVVIRKFSKIDVWLYIEIIYGVKVISEHIYTNGVALLVEF